MSKVQNDRHIEALQGSIGGIPPNQTGHPPMHPNRMTMTKLPVTPLRPHPTVRFLAPVRRRCHPKSLRQTG